MVTVTVGVEPAPITTTAAIEQHPSRNGPRNRDTPMYSAETTFYQPGDHVGVEFMTDADGTVPERDKAVEIVGQRGEHTQVALTTGPGGIGQVVDMPDEYNWLGEKPADFGNNARIGIGVIFLHKPLRWFTPAEGAELTPGDQVVTDAEGVVREYDSSAAPGAEDTADTILGTVWGTYSTEFEHAGKVAIALEG